LSLAVYTNCKDVQGQDDGDDDDDDDDDDDGNPDGRLEP
jgi:hypothetical protein